MENTIPPGFHLGTKEVHGSIAGEGAAVKSAAAVELGRRNAGRPKTVTPARLEQLRTQAAVARAAKVVVQKPAPTAPQAESPTAETAPASSAESPAEKTVLAPKIVVVQAKKEVIRR